MACVNVNRSLSDQFYRYKMPKLSAKVEGKGNGIKTVIVNMVDIAKSLNRPPMYPTKYFGCVLGAQVNYDTKNERYIVNGSHESDKLQDLLDGFIQKYVLCPSCHNPETVLGVIQKKSLITTSCQACGYNGTLNNRDKLATYILKNPPNSATAYSNSGSAMQSGKKTKRKSKDEKSGKKQSNGDTSVTTVTGGDSDEFNDENTNNCNNEEDWGDDIDPDSVAKRMNELSAGAKGLMLNDDLDKSSKDRLMMFFELVKKLKEKHDGIFDQSVQKEIAAEADRLDIKEKAVVALCELLFDERIIQQIKAHRMLFLRFTAKSIKAQKYLLKGFMMTVKLYRNQLMPRVAHILKAFYDADILDEKVIIDWDAKANKKTGDKDLEEICEKAAPFINWLKEAEEEEEEEEEKNEEEDIEVVYDDRAPATEVVIEQEKKPAPALAKPVEEERADDIDIDAI